MEDYKVLHDFVQGCCTYTVGDVVGMTKRQAVYLVRGGFLKPIENGTKAKAIEAGDDE